MEAAHSSSKIPMRRALRRWCQPLVGWWHEQSQSMQWCPGRRRGLALKAPQRARAALPAALRVVCSDLVQHGLRLGSDDIRVGSPKARVEVKQLRFVRGLVAVAQKARAKCGSEERRRPLQSTEGSPGGRRAASRTVDQGLKHWGPTRVAPPSEKNGPKPKQIKKLRWPM
eukprot:scaffold2438_cov257-Pinguiococcus_pyrenoidosus.AAC.7